MGNWIVLFETDECLLIVADYNDEGVMLSHNPLDVKLFEVYELYDFINQAHEHLDKKTCEQFLLVRVGI